MSYATTYYSKLQLMWCFSMCCRLGLVVWLTMSITFITFLVKVVVESSYRNMNLYTWCEFWFFEVGFGGPSSCATIDFKCPGPFGTKLSIGLVSNSEHSDFFHLFSDFFDNLSSAWKWWINSNGHMHLRIPYFHFHIKHLLLSLFYVKYIALFTVHVFIVNRISSNSTR